MIRVKDLGIAQSGEKSERSDIKHSGFLVTINTNYRPSLPTEARDMAEKLHRFMGYLTSDNILPYIFKFLPPHENDKFNSNTILNVNAEYRVERGGSSKGGRIHAHLFIKVEHRTKLQIDPNALRSIFMDYDEFKNDPRVSNPHIDIKAVSVDANIDNYLRK